jgi:hypothetical protein
MRQCLDLLQEQAKKVKAREDKEEPGVFAIDTGGSVDVEVPQ